MSHKATRAVDGYKKICVQMQFAKRHLTKCCWDICVYFSLYLYFWYRNLPLNRLIKGINLNDESPIKLQMILPENDPCHIMPHAFLICFSLPHRKHCRTSFLPFSSWHLKSHTKKWCANMNTHLTSSTVTPPMTALCSPPLWLASKLPFW